jgi:hypothetical protein
MHAVPEITNVKWLNPFGLGLQRDVVICIDQDGQLPAARGKTRLWIPP